MKKKIGLKKPFLHDKFFPHEDKIDFSINLYLKDFAAGKFDKIWMFGVTDEDGGKWLLQDMTETPHALFAGATGSGKSGSCSFVINTWMAANPYRTQLFLVDAKKGADDYSSLFHLKNVYRVTNEDPNLSVDTGIKRVIDLVYSEYEERVKAFSKVGANNLNKFEQRTGKEVSRIVILFEEFAAVPEKMLNFSSDKDKKYTSAAKFFDIMRAGRSYGIWVIAASQRTTSGDIPTDIVSSFVNKFVFKVSAGESAYVLGDDRAARLDKNMKGRCFTETSTIQFPYMSKETQEKMIKKYVDPMKGCEAISFFLSEERIKAYLSGKKPKDLYKIRKKTEIAEAVEQLDGDTVIEILHEEMGHQYEVRDSTTDFYGVSGIATNKDGQKIAVLYLNSKKLGTKKMINLAQAVKEYGCSYGILYCLAENLNQRIYTFAEDHLLKILDHDDMIRIARMIDGGKGELAERLIEKIANVADDDLADPTSSDELDQDEKLALSNNNKKKSDGLSNGQASFYAGFNKSKAKHKKKNNNEDDYRKEYLKPSSIKLIDSKKSIDRDNGTESMLSSDDVDKFLEELGLLPEDPDSDPDSKN